MEQACQRCGQYTISEQVVGLNVCAYCAVHLAAPPLPQLEDLETSDLSQCRRCGFLVNGSIVCQQCGYVELTLCGDPEPVQQAAGPQFGAAQNSKCWTCGNCKYEYNLLESGTCGKCSQPMMSSDQSNQVPTWATEAGPSYYEAPSQVPWSCGYCGLGAGYCNCYAAVNYVQTVEGTNPPPIMNTWRCHNCEHENSSQEATCSNCEYIPLLKCGICGNECEGEICQQCLSNQAAHRVQTEAKPVQSPQPQPKQQISSPVPQAVVQPEVQRREQKAKPSAEPKTSSKSPIIPSTQFWKCKTCSRKHDDLKVQCFCGEYRHWEDYCDAKGIKLNEAKDKWLCNKCGKEVSLSQAMCGACGKMNKDVSVLINGEAHSGCRIF